MGVVHAVVAGFCVFAALAPPMDVGGWSFAGNIGLAVANLAFAAQYRT